MDDFIWADLAVAASHALGVSTRATNITITCKPIRRNSLFVGFDSIFLEKTRRAEGEPFSAECRYTRLAACTGFSVRTFALTFWVACPISLVAKFFSLSKLRTLTFTVSFPCCGE